MDIACIICEFNPFHQGHRYLIESVRRDLHPDAVICIMSGNFVQRGSAAVQPKLIRAENAINGGADLVLQMPVCISVSSASYFASGACNIAKALGCKWLCFGSESGDLTELKKMSDVGIDKIEEGNNILAAEYLRNIGDMIPYTVKIRDDLGHASEMRKNMPNYNDITFSLLQYRIITLDESEIAKAPEVSEGLENRIKKVFVQASDLDGLVKSIKSKRYTYTRISRMLVQILLGIESSIPENIYAHILAFNQTGREFLKEYSDLKKDAQESDNTSICLYSSLKPEDTALNKDLALDVRADDIFAILSGAVIYNNSDFVLKPIIL